jgi:hypothetical protein
MSMPMSIHLEMGVARERGASLNGSGVECGIKKVEMCNGMCRKELQSGAVLKAIVESGKVQEVTEGIARFLRIATPYLSTIVTIVTNTAPI